MALRPLLNRAITMACLGSIFLPGPLLKAEPAKGQPIGRLAASGLVSIGNVPAPGGTSLFSGDRLSAQDSPALVHLGSGSTIVLTRGAEATISRHGSDLLLKAEKGVIGFHFVPAENVRIMADRFQFRTAAKGRHGVGELQMADGRVSMSLSSGRFSALDTGSGKTFSVSALPQAVPKTPPTGKGELVNDSSSFTDPTASWKKDKLKNLCIVSRGEAHRILGNKSNTLTIEGTWLLFSGVYDYIITTCTAQGLADAGAEIGIEEALSAPAPPVAPVVREAGISAGTKAAIALGAGGGTAAAGTAVAVTRDSKSP